MFRILDHKDFYKEVNEHHPKVGPFTSAGQPLPADVCLKYQAGEQYHRAASGTMPAFSHLRVVMVQLPPLPARELKIWVHQLNPKDGSELLPAQVTIHQGSHQQRFDLTSSSEQITLPVNDQAVQVEIRPL